MYHLQYGFRQGGSTELAVSDIIDDLTNSMENKLINCSVFLDLAKAFNTVNHQILLKKLESYGVRGVALKLLRSYLTGRTQITLVNNNKSNSKGVDSGVPQGSTLGPLLFLIYINDLPLATNMKVRLFADDACLSFENTDPLALQQQTNQELLKVNNWLNQNKLFLNYSKSNFIIFTKKKINHNFKITIADNQIQQVRSTKYLGVVLDEKLNWEPHIKSLKSKLSRTSFIFNRLKNYTDTKTLLMVYFSLFYSHLQYCITSWGKAADKFVSKIFILQKRVIRYISKVSSRTSTHSLFKDLKLLKLNEIYELQVGKLMYKVNSNLTVGENRLTDLNNMHNYNTRLSAKSNFYVRRPRTNLGKISFSYTGPKVWQSIPQSFKSLDFVSFKNKFKEHLLKKY